MNYHETKDFQHNEIKSMLEDLNQKLEEEGKNRLVAQTYLNTDEACAMLGICRKTLYKFRMEGKIRYSKPGRKVIFKASDIEAFVNSRRL